MADVGQILSFASFCVTKDLIFVISRNDSQQSFLNCNKIEYELNVDRLGYSNVNFTKHLKNNEKQLWVVMRA